MRLTQVGPVSAASPRSCSIALRSPSIIWAVRLPGASRLLSDVLDDRTISEADVTARDAAPPPGRAWPR